MILETKRLILRPPKKSDWKDIVEGAGNIEVSKNLSLVPHPYTKKDAQKWIKGTIKKWKKKDKKDITFFIELKSERKIIGVTSIHNIDMKDKKATTGSWLNKKYWRKGYMTEAKIPVLDFAFNKIGLKKIETEAFVENISSNGMSKKLGFKKEGLLRKTTVSKATGKVHDANTYGLMKEEWVQTRTRLIKELLKK
ncbi:hypothetical protein COU60_03330 [Candidatus Pacearchaeota archaeon CG10_big_fil_rev_8_21_14_0_10_34_76]|nr:MAG: hypothetical protein COU60_03330 [Candidatus Pacearchaeota archaeon CG10_big_fil_rev_8_21_14_0_10_34_76]